MTRIPSSLDVSKIIASIALCELAGLIGFIFTFSTIPAWYQTLSKPEFTPPNWVFGPVWIIIYAFVGISLYIIWTKRFRKDYTRNVLYIFFIQLLLNALWSILFFGFKSPLLAFADIIILWMSIALTMLMFYKISKTATYLLVPYIAWVSFAVSLNFAILLLN